MVVPAYYTADMVRALPDDGKRYEVVHGELLVTPAPRTWHQEIVGRLYRWLCSYVEVAAPSLHVFASPADISWSDDTLVQPDVFVVPRTEAATLDWRHIRDLQLVVEVLSPASTRADRFAKRRLYQEQRIAEYWIVDADEQAVEVWTPEAVRPVVERERVVWQPGGAGRRLTLVLEELFRPI
jgi:Uma2 family endonuclease